MIRFDSVSKVYRGGARPALDQVSLQIGSGEFVFLVGASGSGKSSLLRLMLREEKPSTGEIHVLGQRLTSISGRKVPYFRRSLGVVFQDFRLLPNKTVHDNVAFTLQVIGRSRGFIQEAVPDVLRMVGLEDKAQNMPHELSGGEQQRVAIARAVVNKPKILLADEPTGNLDPTTSSGIMHVLQLINGSGTTVVMATHDVTIVDRMQRRVVELVGGRIVRDEVEAGYTTTALPVQDVGEEQAVQGEQSAFVPVWARSATGPVVIPATARTPGAAPRIATGPVRIGTGPVVLPAADREDRPTASAPVPAPAPADERAAARPGRASGGSTVGDLDRPVPARAHRNSTAPIDRPLVPRSATGPNPIVSALPTRTGAERGDESPRVAGPRRRADPGLTGEDPRPAPRRARRSAVEGDGDAAVRRPASASAGRDELPEHLDFVGGLRLDRNADDESEIGPSS